MSKVYYNITESNYEYKYKDYSFIFSSEYYKKLFMEKLENFIEEEKRKLDYKYNANVECKIVLMIELYRKIEKRGFLVKYENKELKIKDYLFAPIIND